jgi:hypothetical protein
LIRNFDSWTSGDEDIDTFIQKTQAEAQTPNDYLEWIDPQRVTTIRRIANGGFGSVYEGTWEREDQPKLRFVRVFDKPLRDGKVVLKVTYADASTFVNQVK